jgi:hypothetical protein
MLRGCNVEGQAMDEAFATDWYALRDQYRERFQGRTTRKAPGLPGGRNFMTPELLGYVRAATGEACEIASGTDFSHAFIIGVTYPKLADGSPDPRGRCCWSWAEVEDALGYGEREA